MGQNNSKWNAGWALVFEASNLDTPQWVIKWKNVYNKLQNLFRLVLFKRWEMAELLQKISHWIFQKYSHHIFPTIFDFLAHLFTAVAELKAQANRRFAERNGYEDGPCHAYCVIYCTLKCVVQSLNSEDLHQSIPQNFSFQCHWLCVLPVHWLSLHH